MEIVDFTGREILLSNKEIVSGINNIELNTDLLSKGIYLLKIQTKDGVITQRIMKN